MPPVRSDVIILGAGPAGLSAALWANELGLSCTVLEETDEAGGQLLSTFNRIDNHLGASTKNGEQLRDRFLEQLSSRKTHFSYGNRVNKIRLADRAVILEDNSDIRFRYLIICTGVRRRKLGIPGEEEFAGKGVLYSGKRDRDKAVGKPAVVVGGGDAAFENALILSSYASRVFLVHRREKFSARDEFVSDVLKHPSIEVVTNAEVKEIKGAATVEEVLVVSKSESHRTIRAESVVIRIGVKPNSEFAQSIAETDRRGYLVVGSDCSTSVETVFAAGDVANPVSPTVSTAVGMGATAIKRIHGLLRNESV